MRLRTGGRALGLVALVVLQGLVSPYVAAATLAPLLAIGVARLVWPARRRQGLTLLAVVGAAAVVLFAAFLGVVSVRLANPSLADQSVWRRHRLRATELPWDLLDPAAATAVAPAALALVAAGGLVRAVRRRRGSDLPLWAVAASWTVVGLFASLPPVVRWYGAPITLPQQLLAQWTPLYEVIRFPERLAVASLVGLSLLAGLAFVECGRHIPLHRGARVLRPALALAFALVTYRQYAHGSSFGGEMGAPLPRAYPLREAIGPRAPLMDVLRRPGGPLLEIPLGPLRGGDSAADAPLQARAAYRSIFHRRKILNGYTSYWPAGFPERMALVRRLPDRAALAALRDETGLELILVHTSLFGAIERQVCASLARRNVTADVCRTDPGAEERRTWLALAATGGRDDLPLLARAGDDLLFRVAAVR